MNNFQDFLHNYQKKFAKEVYPQLKDFERERKYIIEQCKRITNTQYILCILAFLIYVIVSVTFSLHDYNAIKNISLLSTSLNSCSLTFLITTGLICLWAYLQKSTYKTCFIAQIKTKVMPVLMQAFDTFQWWSYCNAPLVKNIGTKADFKVKLTDTAVPYEVLSSSMLYTNPGILLADDNFKGTYKGIQISITRAAFSYGVDENRPITEGQGFSGILILLDIKKNFSGYTLIRTPRNRDLKMFEKVKLEDPVFSKRFCIFSNDQTEARYLLTPTFISRFLKLQKAFNGDKIEASFFDDKLLISIERTEGGFNLGDINTPVDNTEQYKVLYNEIVSILRIIDILKLNQNIGL